MEHPWQCDNCGYTVEEQAVRSWQRREKAAWHEAGHAVMRWLRLGEAGPICIHPDGTGLSAAVRYGMRLETEDHLLILVAGLVAEAALAPMVIMQCGLNVEQSSGEDLDRARALFPSF